MERVRGLHRVTNSALQERHRRLSQTFILRTAQCNCLTRIMCQNTDYLKLNPQSLQVTPKRLDPGHRVFLRSRGVRGDGRPARLLVETFAMDAIGQTPGCCGAADSGFPATSVGAVRNGPGP